MLRLTLAAVLLAAPAAAADLRLPLACTPGTDCVVQNFVDVDPSAKAGDFACGAMSYDGHDGTDFRVPPGAQVAVRAAAEGVVRATRDGEAERSFRAEWSPDPQRACGNAVVIDHPGGLSTMYCHMAKGSIAVATGDRVAAGDVVGAVGASGSTEFRHLHLGVRQDGTSLDPFTGRPVGAGCGVGDGLWAPDAAAALAGAGETAAFAVGFADHAVTLPEIEDGATGTVSPDSKAVVAYGVVVGTHAGDEVRLALSGPDTAVSDGQTEPRARAQSMIFVGRSRPPAPGSYAASLTVVRAGKEIARREATLTVR